MLAFCYFDGFEQLSRYPLKLTQGDIDSNIDELANKNDLVIEDETTRQFRDALHSGWSPASARNTLK